MTVTGWSESSGWGCVAKMGGVAQVRASSVWSMKRFFFITGGGQVLRLATSAEPDVGRIEEIDRFSFGLSRPV